MTQEEKKKQILNIIFKKSERKRERERVKRLIQLQPSTNGHFQFKKYICKWHL